MSGRRWQWVIGAGSLALGCAAPIDTSWHEETGFRWRSLEVASGGSAGFTRLDAGVTGITHANMVDDAHALANRHLIIGAGAAAADVDGDGRVDLFLASVEAPPALYRNTGNLRFEDVTQRSGLAMSGRATTGATFADVDGDRDPDLLIGSLGGPLCLYLNDGRGVFSEATRTSGLDSGYAVTTLTLADVDADGDLDLYAATYKQRNALDAYPPQARAFDQVVKKVGTRYEVLPQWAHEFRVEDRPDLGGIVRSQRAEPDLFYLNDGRGHFTRAPTFGPRWRDEDGAPLTTAPDYFSLAARFYDVNGDGAPDLYVCNDFEDPDQFWLNDGRGNFRMVPRLAIRATSNTCMSVDFADVNRDGAVDLFTADMLSPTREARQRQIPTHTPLPKTTGESPDRAQWMRNALHVARGDGTWAQIADQAGVAASDWTWGSAFLDVDLDGFEDLLVAAGHRWDVRDADTFDRIRNAFPRVAWNREQGEFPRLAVPNVAWRNAGDETFADVSTSWGWGVDSAVSHAIALADFDGDGDIDPVVTRLDDAPQVYRNNTSAPRLLIRLLGALGNTAGTGAVVTVRAASLPAQAREVTAGGYYLSGSDPALVFAMGKDTVAAVEVRWPGGRVSRLSAGANRGYEIREPEADGASVAPLPAAPRPLFADATPALGGHRHLESRFDDVARQPLLPNRFSQFGPGVSWMDLDGDDREDLVVGAGRGGALAVFRNTPGGFRYDAGPIAPGDIGIILPLARRTGTSLLAGTSNYEALSAAEAVGVPSVALLGRGTGASTAGRGPWTSRAVVPGDTATVGPMAMGDVNGDGILDLFVGTRIVPGAWPLPARSHLYTGGADGTFRVDDGNVGVLGSLGLVTGATFADLNGDGRADLVVASEWGPVRVLLNRDGRLVDETKALGLAGTTSRWMGVSAGDFDSDGRLDLVATSWGRNSPVRATVERPLVLHVGRMAGTLGLVFAQADSDNGPEMPMESLSRLGVALPFVRERIASYRAYSTADVQAVLGDAGVAVVRVGATTLDHTVFLNRGDHFESRGLPAVAQRAPSFGPVVADFDGDGREDLFLAQNFFPTEIGALRQDAGAGLLLRGDGSGGFTPMSVAASGISVLGDQRGAATADYDGDARPDLVVAQNGWLTRLFHNEGARPGLRVSLVGPEGNSSGVGAQLRVVARTARGPVREVRLGTGPWSVDGAITVLARPEGADSLWVRWPGGATQVVAIPASALAVTVRATR